MHQPPFKSREAAGFTLLELMTVLGIISVLAGVGIGFLSRSGNDMEVAVAVIRDKVRLAHESARSSGRTATIELVQRVDRSGGASEIIGQFLRAKILTTVGQWHLEPGERAFSGLEPVLAGDPDSAGRFGACMRPDPEKGTMFSVDTADQSSFSIPDGFALRVEVYLEERDSCVVATMAPTFRLELDRDGRPLARMFLAAEDGKGRGPQVRIDTEESELPLRRWVSLGLEHDGRMLRLLVDGEVIGETSARGEPYQDVRQRAPFEVSSQEGPVPGKIDEIVLLAYDRDDPAEISYDITIKGLEEPIIYDRRGVLTRPVTLELTLEDQVRKLTIAPGGVLQ